ncbi:protein THEM6-like [Notechis scutatus]|uniref:Protein THEM6 n=1 Tax=Notechis scutatus TaxID=8663 RepID=A0A6J1VRS7_9SAUR|nr:protein THEM6-like [Notechis scutatus]
MSTLLLICGTAAATFFTCLDGWYLLRMPFAYLYARWLLPRIADPLQEQQYRSWVLPSDLDLLVHMNNARYPREADMARCVYMVRCGIFQAIRALGGRTMLSASCCRFRRSLHLFERFTIQTRIRGWDHRAFFLEQRFVSARDGFVCAVLLVRQHVTGTTPRTAVEQVCRRKVESPALSEEIQHWLRYNEASSQNLRMESNVQEKSKAP